MILLSESMGTPPKEVVPVVLCDLLSSYLPHETAE